MTACSAIPRLRMLSTAGNEYGKTNNGGFRWSCGGPIPGFAHLEPCRHIPFVTGLDGPEAESLGAVLAGATRVLREAAGAERTYVYVFGDHVPHLHFNLAPHRDGDALRGGPGLLATDTPDPDMAVHRAVAEAAARALATGMPEPA